MVAGSPKTWTTNEYITATKLNAEIRDQVLAKTGAPRAYIWKSTKATYTSSDTAYTGYGTWEPYHTVHLDQVLFDYSSDGTKMANGDGRLYVNRPGIYFVTGTFTWGVTNSASLDTPQPTVEDRIVAVGQNMNGNFLDEPADAAAGGGSGPFVGKTSYLFGRSNSNSAANLPACLQVSGLMPANRGDHFQLFCAQDSGAPLDCVASQGTVFLQASWMGDL